MHVVSETETKHTIDSDGSEHIVTVAKTTKVERLAEPDYIKIYTEMWCAANQIPMQYRNLFLHLVCRMTYASLNDIFSFPACTRDATVWEKGNKTCGGTELFARTSFQPTSQPQFSLGIVDVWCRFAQAGTTEITSILSLSHKPRTV